MSAKSDNSDWKDICQNKNETAGEIKKLSYKIILIENWDQIKFDVMRSCLFYKFNQEPFKTRLINTGNQNIVEGNSHGDKVWGVDLLDAPNLGENHLGRMIMEIRQYLNKLDNVR